MPTIKLKKRLVETGQLDLRKALGKPNHDLLPHVFCLWTFLWQDYSAVKC